MMTRTRVARVTFTRRFKLASMDRDYPPGIYEIETDDEILDTVSVQAHRRTATRIRLNNPGLTQLVTIDPQDLEAALINDSPADYGETELKRVTPGYETVLARSEPVARDQHRLGMGRPKT